MSSTPSMPIQIWKEFTLGELNSLTASQSSTSQLFVPSVRMSSRSSPPLLGSRSVQKGASTLLGGVALGKLWLTKLMSAPVPPPTTAYPLLTMAIREYTLFVKDTASTEKLKM